MKHKPIILATILLTLIVLISCNKPESELQPYIPSTFTTEMNFLSNGILSYNEYSGDTFGANIVDSSTGYWPSISYTIIFNVNSAYAKKHPIRFYFDSIPIGLTVPTDTTTITSNYSYTGQLSFTDSLNSGTFRFYLTVVSDTGVQKMPVIISIVPCISGSLGTYSGCKDFSNISGTPPYTSIVDTIAGMPNWITISNFNNLGIAVRAQYFAFHDTLIIPSQTFGGYSVKGHGNFVLGYSTIWLRDTVIFGGDTTYNLTEM